MLTLVLLAGVAGARSLPRGIASPPVPADNPMSSAKVALGRLLFYDADLSVDGTMSCATCHEQKHAFADGNRTRPGVHGDPGRRNVPGLANVAWLRPLTWADPALGTLEAQIAVPLFGDHPVEMGMKGKDAELGSRLSGNACYRTMFRKAFPEREGMIDVTTVAMAIASFERSLISLDSPWDRYKRGYHGAMSTAAIRGAGLFNGAAGCGTCHSGPNFTDARFHQLRLPKESGDRGLEEKTRLSADRGHFRTPGLRNVSVTAPYLHDGSAPDLATAIAIHAGTRSESERDDLIAFLDALTDRRFITDPRHAIPVKACGRRL